MSGTFKAFTFITQESLLLSGSSTISEGGYDIVDEPDNSNDSWVINVNALKVPDNHYLIPRLEYDILPYVNPSESFIEIVNQAVVNTPLVEIALTTITDLLERNENENAPNWDLSPRGMETPPLSPRLNVTLSFDRPLSIDPDQIEDYRINAMGAYFSMLYGIPFKTPEFVIINGLRIAFISFSEVSQIQIVRYELNPYLQMYATQLPYREAVSSPNRIITLFGSNGLTYLVKAKYDPVSQQIFPPL